MSEEISFEIGNEQIVFAELTNRENTELIIIGKSGNVFLFDCRSQESRLLHNLGFPLEYSEDLFKYLQSAGYKKDFLQVQSYRDYICIVQKYRQSGIVINLELSDFKKELNRGDYCVEHCSFPVAFYSKGDFTYLIHGTDWNRLDVTCLETDELLTARIVDYDTNSNYFDYFHSSLTISPDAKHFTSNGWVWHPYGQITLYSIEKFLQNFELSHENIDLAEDCYSFDWDRPICWLDEKILAIGFSKNTEDYGKSNFQDEILFVDIIENKIVRRIEFDGFANTPEGDVFGELFYNKEKSQFISLNNQKGLYISDANGVELYKNSNLTSHKYSAEHKIIYRIDYELQKIEITGLPTS